MNKVTVGTHAYEFTYSEIDKNWSYQHSDTFFADMHVTDAVETAFFIQYDPTLSHATFVCDP